MAKLKKCKSCDQDVSKKATTCPNCGAPLKKSKAGLKFLFIVGMGIALGFAIVKSKEGAAKKKVEETKQAKEMPVSNISWDTINNIYDVNSKYTDLQKKEAWKKYKDKKIQWTGKNSYLKENRNKTLSLGLKMNSTTISYDVLIELDPSEREKALALKEGATVTVTAILKEWGTLMPITANHGKIE